MEILLSVAGIISSLSLIFWLILPFIYPKYYTVRNLVPQIYEFLFISFFLSHFLIGILLILTEHSVFGLALLLFLTGGYGFILYLISRKILENGIFTLVLDSVYGSIHQILFYCFIAGMLFYSIYLFYNKSILSGAIIGYILIFYLISNILVLTWYHKKRKNIKLSFSNKLKATKATHSEKVSLTQVLNDFETDISNSFYQLAESIDTLLFALSEYVYSKYIPEKLKTSNSKLLLELISKYVLNLKSIPDDEKTILRNLIEKRKEIVFMEK